MKPPYWLLFLPCLIVPTTGWSHPVSYKGAFSVMSWNQPDATDWMLTYTHARSAAVAAHYFRIDTEDGPLRAGLAGLNWRVKRWNAPDTQANMYLSVGAGGARRADDTSPAGFAAFQVDHESRRHLLWAEASTLRPDDGPSVYRWEARAGLAPYLAAFDEPAAWLIVSLQGQPQMEQNMSLVPMLRVFYRNVLGEAGAGARGDWMFNFMVHF